MLLPSVLLIGWVVGVPCEGDTCPVWKLPLCDSAYSAEEPKDTLTRRVDYVAANYMVDNVELEFELDASTTIVRSKLSISRDASDKDPIVLSGSPGLELLYLAIDDGVQRNILENREQTFVCLNSTDDSLVIRPTEPFFPLTDSSLFNLLITVRIHPNENTKLFGLYESDGLLVTQNEAQGFRHITYFPDRPDILSTYRVTLKADKDKYPVLLSNGDLVASEVDSEYPELHSATFYDPHPKPCYLFALVAGDLARVSSEFTIRRPCTEAVQAFYEFSVPEESNIQAPHLMKYCHSFPQAQSIKPKVVNLNVWGRPGRENKLRWSLESIEKAMLWDEIVYGRYYDLDTFHVVSTRDFNAGAMENKGLNIFNAALVEASHSITTDSQYVRIQGVIAHEYFHNWSGDRVTCRDWFQLSLKEGFTVYRDQRFTQDAFNTSSKRIEDVKYLTDVQFREDNGPLRHPIRPEAYASIENFYTVTVYEKGAEIVRMYDTLLGWETFRKGTDIYFSEFDGKAATCENFLGSMEKASGRDLSQFFNWYASSGTPVVTLVDRFQNGTQLFLKLRQKIPQGGPLLIPLVIGFLSATSNEDVLPTQILEMTKVEETFVIENISEPTIPAINRGFSAPIIVTPYLNQTELLHQAQFDSCGYIRWDSTQIILSNAVTRIMSGSTELSDVKNIITTVLNQFLKDDTGDLQNVAYRVQFPIISSYERSLDVFDPAKVFNATQTAKLVVLEELKDLVWEAYDRTVALLNEFPQYEVTTRQVGIRSLKNALLALLSTDKSDERALHTIYRQLEMAQVENEASAALFMAVQYPSSPTRDDMLETYRQRAGTEDLLINRWLSAQASSAANDTLDNVKRLANLGLYKESKTPNRIRALVGAFVQNTVAFNEPSGKAYDFVVDEIIRIDSFNPKVAARLAAGLTNWGRLPDGNRLLMRSSLRRLLGTSNLSTQTREIVTKALTADHRA